MSKEKRVILHALPSIGITGTVEVIRGKQTYVKMGTEQFSTCPYVVVVEDGDDCDEITDNDVIKALGIVSTKLQDAIILQSKRLAAKVKSPRL